MSYALKEGFRGLGRDRLQSLIAIGVTTASLFIFGIFLLVTRNLQKFVDVAREKVEISAYLQEDLSKRDLENLQGKIKGFVGIKEVLYISKEDALEILTEDLGEDSDLLNALEINPLPPSFKISLHPSHKESEEVGALAHQIEGFEVVVVVDFGEEWVERLDQWIQIFFIVDFTMGFLIGGASLFVIFNTILFTVFSKREEIEIMSLVGATEGFIRRPFLVAGSLYGLLGGGLAALLILGLTHLARTRLPDIASLEGKFLFGIVGFGLLLGLGGSSLSVRRFVKIWPK